jgi:hypothetical protein
VNERLRHSLQAATAGGASGSGGKDAALLDENVVSTLALAHARRPQPAAHDDTAGGASAPTGGGASAAVVDALLRDALASEAAFDAVAALLAASRGLHAFVRAYLSGEGAAAGLDAAELAADTHATRASAMFACPADRRFGPAAAVLLASRLPAAAGPARTLSLSDSADASTTSLQHRAWTDVERLRREVAEAAAATQELRVEAEEAAALSLGTACATQ